MLVFALTLATACSFAPRVDTELLTAHDLASDSPTVCIPPGTEASQTVHVVGSDPFDLSGVLVESLYVDDAMVRGLTANEGTEVSVWSYTLDTLEPIAELDASSTDASGAFTLTVDPTGLSNIGLLVDGEYAYPLRWKHRPDPDSDGGGGLVCAYWSNLEGDQIAGASRGQDVQLVVRSTADYDPPHLSISEVGNDLSGNDRVDSFTGEPFVDGVSATPWVVSGEDGVLGGNRIELAFSAFVSEPDSDHDFALGSDWLFAN